MSVAQGGRKIATTGSFDAPQSTDVFTLLNGTWTRSSISGAFMTFFLERDTAHLRSTWTPTREDLYVRIGSSDPARSTSERWVTEGAPGGPNWAEWSWMWPSVSPTGDWVLFDWIHDDNCAVYITLYAFNLRSPVLKNVHRTDACAGAGPQEDFGPTAWRSDGAMFVSPRARWATSGPAPYDIAIRRFQVNGTTITDLGNPPVIPGRYPRGVYWEPEGSRIRSSEAPHGFLCSVSTRSAADPSVVLSTSPTCDTYPMSGPTFSIGAAAAPEVDPRIPRTLRGRTNIRGETALRP